MELAGLEPATSWVRFKPARQIEVPKHNDFQGLLCATGLRTDRICADMRRYVGDSGTLRPEC